MAKLELLASGPGTGKTTYCIELFRKEILRSPAGLDSRAFFVLPNREHAGRIQNLVLKKDTPGLFNVHILTIQELETRLSGAAHRPRPGESVRRLILRSIVEDPSQTWEYLEPVKDLPGFYELLSERLQEFRDELLSAEELVRRAKKAGGDSAFRAKTADLARLMDRYDEELLARGFSESDTSEAEFRFASDPPLVLLDGFYHFTRSQKALIRALALSGARMVATLTLPEASEKRPHVFELVENTRTFLEEAGFESSAAKAPKNRRTASLALAHLERSVFLPRPGRLTGAQDAVQLITAETVHDEIEAIAREVRRLHRDTPWHYSDMAVILRSLQGYEKSIAAVFGEYGIPVSVHERRKTVETGLGRFIHTLLSLFLDGWASQDLISLLKSGYPSFRPAAEVTAKLERSAFARNVRSGADAWKGLADDPSLQDLKPALNALTEIEASLMKAPSARSFRLAFSGLLASCSLDAASGDHSALRALQMLAIRAESAYADPGRKAFLPERFAEELKEALEAGLFSERPEGKNRVQVYDAVMALPKEYRVVFIAGLLDQRFPQPVNEDPFFKDQERAVLNGKDPILELRAPRRSGERYFFYMALTRARDRLYLSHPRKDRDGKPYLRSVFVDEVRRCFTELPLLESGPDRETTPRAWVAEHQAQTAAAGMLFAAEGALKEPEKRAVLAYAAARKAFPRFARILEAGSSGGPARFSDARILDQVRAEAKVFSPTRLETFLTCSFKYFADHTLKLKPYLEDRLRAETGTMLHAVLESYYARRRGEDDLFRDLEVEFDRSPLAAEPAYRRAYLMERARRTLRLFLRVEEKASANGFVPSHFELAFGKKRDGTPARYGYLDVAGSGVLVGGSIDRVDISADGRRALVIDYKLGSRDLKKKLEKGLEVQLPLYLLAARQLLGLEPAGAELRFLESGKRSALKSEELEGLLEATQTRVIDAARRIREGDISVRSRSCQYCNFATLCRFEPWKLIYAEVDRV